MSWILLGNDDGADAPPLAPFAAALEAAFDLPVCIAVPAGERSWSGKAITRIGSVHVEWVRRDGREVAAVHGTPADAIQLGLYSLFADRFGGAPPRAAFTGINLGFNHGTAFMSSSGTVWAAIEASLAGIPSVAFSTGERKDFATWRRHAESPAATEEWQRLVQVATDTAVAISDTDLVDHCDVVSVNMPWSATAETPRRVTSLSPLTYGPLFVPEPEDGRYTFTTDLSIAVGDLRDDADVACIRDETISITPIDLPSSPAVREATRAALEGR